MNRPLSQVLGGIAVDLNSMDPDGAPGSVAATTGAEARPYGFHGGYGGYHGGYYRGRRGIGTGAAIGLGIAGLAAGAIAAGAVVVRGIPSRRQVRVSGAGRARLRRRRRAAPS